MCQCVWDVQYSIFMHCCMCERISTKVDLKYILVAHRKRKGHVFYHSDQPPPAGKVAINSCIGPPARPLNPSHHGFHCSASLHPHCHLQHCQICPGLSPALITSEWKPNRGRADPSACLLVPGDLLQGSLQRHGAS